MDLTPIKIPEIALPFDIPVLIHPAVAHFMIAIPVIVLLIELINLFSKKKAIGVVSFFLLTLVVVAAAAAYLTGTTDGKEAYDLLSQAGQAELKEHKILGTYLMLASAVVLLFKLLSAMVNRGLMKALYIFVLIFFVVGILKQGKEGGELVYTYGANTAPAKAYSDLKFTIDDMDDDDTMADLKEELAPEAEEKAGKEESVPAETTAAETTAPAATKVEAPAKKEETAAIETKTEAEAKPEENAAASSMESDTKTEDNTSAEASSDETAPEVEVVPAAAETKPEVATH